MRASRSDWIVPVLLILLSLVPALGGLARVLDLTGPITPRNARFHAAPIPVLLHIASALPFSILGALQFSRTLRRTGHRWHPLVGRVLAPCGIIAALTGLWMAQFYPWPPTDGVLVYLERVVFGMGMLVSLVFALIAVRQRAFRAHGEWMIRAYAIGVGAGTQVLTHLPWFLLRNDEPAGVPRAAMMGAGWIINVLVAEMIIRRSQARNSLHVQSVARGAHQLSQERLAQSGRSGVPLA